MGENPAIVNRSLTSIFNELEFLKDSQVISDSLFTQITTHLPKRYNRGDAVIGPITALNSSTSNSPTRDSSNANTASNSFGNEKQEYSAPPPRPVGPSGQNDELVEALYDYRPSDASDLELRQGCIVEVLEKVNNDWWRGRRQDTSQIGLFPSNYVKSSSGSRDTGRPAPALPSNSYNNSYQQPSSYGPPAYGPPGPQNTGYVPPFPQYNQQDLGYQQSQPPMQAQAVAVQQPQQQQHSAGGEAFKKFGSKLGNAAIFGAGATIGSDIVNSIF